MNDLISVIIPVYNASMYVDELLDSVINQEYKNLQIICIDDGSSDSSLDILERYANIDSRIRVVTKKNTGVSDARNIGIEYSNGVYIYFCDADDCLERTLISKLHTTITGYDLSYVDFVKYEGRFSFSDRNEKVDRNEFCKQVLCDNGYLWNKLFKANLIKEYHIRFCPDIAMSEDQVFILEYLKHISMIQKNDSKLYYYRFNENGALRCKTLNDRKVSACLAVDKIANLVEEGDYSTECLSLAIEKKFRIFAYLTKDLLFKRYNKKLRRKWLAFIANSYRVTKRKYGILIDRSGGIKLRVCYGILQVVGNSIK